MPQSKHQWGKNMKSGGSYLPKRHPDMAKDIRLLHELLPSLGDNAILAIYFRYWENLLIDEIAKILGMSWDQTDKLIENSIKELRHGFLINQRIKQPKAA